MSVHTKQWKSKKPCLRVNQWKGRFSVCSFSDGKTPEDGSIGAETYVGFKKLLDMF
jgi:hypothetical protein